MKTTTIFGTFAAAIVLGTIVGISGGRSTASEALATNAPTTLQRPLSADERKELVQGLQYFQGHDYDDAAPILSKYAMLGEPFSQMEVGMMHYFGKGLALDRDEGLHWMRLAGAQDSVAATMMSAVESGALPSIDGTYQSGQAYAYAPPGSSGDAGGAPDYSASGSAATSATGAQQSSQSWVPQSVSSIYEHPNSPPAIGAESYEPPRWAMGAAARSMTDGDPRESAPSDTGAINVRTGQYMAPAGPGAYLDPQDGTYYAPAGPDGVVDSRTGEYSPVSH